MYTYELRVPKDRIAVLIGKKGSIKKRLMDKLNIRLSIDSKDGSVLLEGEDSFNLLLAQDIIKSISRGFNPDIAELLLDEEYILEIIDITDYSGKSKKKLIRLRSRCIGTNGKARKIIEDLTSCHVSIYGKTISIIGKVNYVSIAKKAFENLLRGSKHGNVYVSIKKLKEGL